MVFTPTLILKILDQTSSDAIWHFFLTQELASVTLIAVDHRDHAFFGSCPDSPSLKGRKEDSKQEKKKNKTSNSIKKQIKTKPTNPSVGSGVLPTTPLADKSDNLHSSTSCWQVPFDPETLEFVIQRCSFLSLYGGGKSDTCGQDGGVSAGVRVKILLYGSMYNRKKINIFPSIFIKDGF